MKALAGKALGFLGANKLIVGVFLAFALLGGFAWLQTDRLSSARATIKAQTETVVVLKDRILSDTGRIAERDRLIAKQNAAVLEIVEQQREDRTAYLASIDAANRRAAGLQAQAADIMKRHVETTDELERAREALKLMVEVVGQES